MYYYSFEGMYLVDIFLHTKYCATIGTGSVAAGGVTGKLFIVLIECLHRQKVTNKASTWLHLLSYISILYGLYCFIVKSSTNIITVVSSFVKIRRELILLGDCTVFT